MFGNKPADPAAIGSLKVDNPLYGQEGNARLLSNKPLEIFNEAPNGAKAADNFRKSYKDNFYSPLKKTTPPGTPVPASLEDIANTAVDPADAAAVNSQQAAKSVVDSLEGGILTTHSAGLSRFFENYNAYIDEKYRPEQTFQWGLNKKAHELSSDYRNWSNSLTTIHQDELTVFEQWFADNQKNILAAYAKQLTGDQEENRKKIYDNYKQAIIDRQNKEKAHLDALSDALKANSVDIAAYSLIRQGNYFKANIPNTGSTTVEAMDGKFADDVRYGRYQNKFEIKDGKVTLDLSNLRDLSNAEKVNVFTDIAAAVRHKQLERNLERFKKGEISAEDINKVKIKISAKVANPNATFFGPEKRLTDELPYTYDVLCSQWKACIDAGYTAEQIVAPPGFEPPENLKEYADNVKARRSIEGINDPNFKRQIENYNRRNKANHFVLTEKDKIAINEQIDPFKYDIHQADPNKPDSIQSLYKNLENIRIGLGYITLGKDAKHAKIAIRKMRANIIANAVIRNAILAGQTEDGLPLIDKLTRKQIDAINQLDFSKCNSATDIANKLNECIYQNSIPTDRINLHSVQFAANWRVASLPGKFAYTNFNLAQEHLFKVEEVKDAQDTAKERAAASWSPSTVALHERLVEAHNKIRDQDNSIQSLGAPLAAGTITYADIKTVAKELKYQAAEEITTLNQMLNVLADKQGHPIHKSSGFRQASVINSYGQIAKTYLADVNATIEKLNELSEIPTLDAREKAKLANMAAELVEKQQELLTNIEHLTHQNLTSAMLLDETPTPPGAFEHGRPSGINFTPGLD